MDVFGYWQNMLNGYGTRFRINGYESINNFLVYEYAELVTYLFNDSEEVNQIFISLQDLTYIDKIEKITGCRLKYREGRLCKDGEFTDDDAPKITIVIYLSPRWRRIWKGKDLINGGTCEIDFNRAFIFKTDKYKKRTMEKILAPSTAERKTIEIIYDIV
jgi:hypothetical protein